MAISSAASEYRQRLFADDPFQELAQKDPEVYEIVNNFMFDEVVNNDDLDDRTRFMCNLATLIGCQGIDLFAEYVPAALKAGVSPVEVKEITYQAIDYLGIGRVYPFLKVVNQQFAAQGIDLPLPGQSTTSPEMRLAAGKQCQIDIFGEGVRDFKSQGGAAQNINKWLVDNCFGDYYTRQGLNYQERELMTFCYLTAQGGVEPQLEGHAEANIQNGNDYLFLIKVISQNLPLIGYPRSLNALRCATEAKAKVEEQ